MTGYIPLDEQKIRAFEQFLYKEVDLTLQTVPHVNQILMPTGEAASREDWEQYGGYPGHEDGSAKVDQTILAAVWGFERGCENFPVQITGINNFEEQTFPIKVDPVTYMESIKCGDVSVPLCDRGIISALDEAGHHALKMIVPVHAYVRLESCGCKFPEVGNYIGRRVVVAIRDAADFFHGDDIDHIHYGPFVHSGVLKEVYYDGIVLTGCDTRRYNRHRLITGVDRLEKFEAGRSYFPFNYKFETEHSKTEVSIISIFVLPD